MLVLGVSILSAAWPAAADLVGLQLVMVSAVGHLKMAALDTDLLSLWLVLLPLLQMPAELLLVLLPALVLVLSAAWPAAADLVELQLVVVSAVGHLKMAAAAVDADLLSLWLVLPLL